MGPFHQIGALLGKNVLAVVAGTVLIGTAAVGVFAAQEDVENLEETPTAEATETPTEEATEEPTATPEPTETTEADPTETPEATPTDEVDDGDGEREVGGIPDDNPVFSPDDDGVCEKHETREMTTPDGTKVNVPCHVVPDDDDDAFPGRGPQNGGGDDEEPE